MPPKRRKAEDEGKKPAKRRSKAKNPEPDSDISSEDDHADDVDTEFGQDTAASSAAESSIKVVLEGDKCSGEVLICGGTNWDLTGRKQPPKSATNVTGRNLYGPHRIPTLRDIPIRTVVSGCNACHSVVITTDGKVYSWGRNESGQLGHSRTEKRDIPMLIDSLSDLNIIRVACGKAHTLFLTETGIVYGTGLNGSGQLGLGNVNPSTVTNPAKVQHKGPPISLIACGGDFSAIGDVNGNIYTFGSPEYGQLGHNSDGKYFVTSSKLGFDFKTRPQRVMVFIDKTKEGMVPIHDVEVKDICCGTNHVVLLDKKERIFTWGFGGYGRLGHSESKDEMIPRLLNFFNGPNRGAVAIASGSTFSLAVNKHGVLYLWGQNKNAGEAAMYPKPIHDLSGWNIRSMACCYKSIVVAADNSVVSWGCSPTYGELCYGENGTKSSSTPQECKPLSGIHIEKIACGYGHSLFLARNSSDEDKEKLAALPDFIP